MDEHVSFLLGSGFSAPENVPTVTEVNKRLRELKEDQFYLGTDQSAFFYKDDFKDPNAWMASSFVDRLFAQEFTAFYCKEILKGNLDDYQYEEFYDYVSEYLRFNKNANEIEKFCNSFRSDKIKGGLGDSNNHNFVWRFSKIFNQLVSDLLRIPKHYEDVSYGNYPTYDPLVGLVREAIKTKIVDVHTLNHDLFFDMLASKHVELWQYFCDGFAENGSPFYGEVSVDHESKMGKVRKSYKVRLKFYNGDFSNKLRLFKLHGSIDNYILIPADKPGGSTFSWENAIRVKRDFGVGQFFMERHNSNYNKLMYERLYTETYPDFITGTTEKLRQYNEPYYENLLSKFRENLQDSNLLFIIGYGFQDKGINGYLENFYLVYNKPLIVIGISQPKHPFFNTYKDQITFIDKGVTGLTFEEYMKLANYS